MSAFQYRDIIARAMRKGYDSVVFPDYRDVAALRAGENVTEEAYKLSYKDVRDKVINEMKTQYGDAVSVRTVSADDFGYEQGYSGTRPLTVLDFSFPPSGGAASPRNVVPRGYAKGGHVRAGIGELFRLYS